MTHDSDRLALNLFLFGVPQLVDSGALHEPLPDETSFDRSNEVRRPSEPDRIKINRRKSLALLAYLSINRKAVQRQVLMALLWPDAKPKLAYSYLRRELTVLTRAVGKAWFITDRESIRLTADRSLWLDVEEFNRNIAQCSRHGHAANDVCPQCMPLLSSAVALYTGDFMTGFSFRDSPEFDEWRFFQAEQLRNDIIGALARLIRGYSAQHRFSKAIDRARLWLELSPWHESVHRELMRLYFWSGNELAALRQYETCAATLETELGLAPEAETVQLYEAVKARTIPPPPAGLFAEAALAGQNGVVQNPDQEITPKIPSAVSPPDDVARDEDSSEATESRHARRNVNNLPSYHTPLVGRENELATLSNLLANESACRMLTLTGPSGVGKTRLAQEAAQQTLASFDNGTFVVYLSDVQSGQLMMQAIAGAVGCEFSRGADPMEQLTSYVRDKSILLLLDSFENLLRNAEASNTERDDADSILLTLLEQAPGLKLLITSLERLNLQAEWVQYVQGLSYPPEEFIDQIFGSGHELPQRGSLDWTSYDAVRLFVQQAGQVQHRHTFNQSEKAAICKICNLVEGSPLALELTASWTRLMSPIEIAQDLYRSLLRFDTSMRDLPQRHRSFTALFEYGWQLIAAEEREAVGKLAFFRSGFDRDSAQHVAEVNLALISSLLDKSILRTNRSGRFWMHAIIRECAVERMQHDPEKVRSIQARHCSYYAAVLRKVEGQIRTSARKRIIRRIALDIENVRRAWKWAIRHEKHSELSNSLFALHRFYVAQEWIGEGEAMFAKAVASLPTMPCPANVAEDGSDVDPAIVFLRCCLLARQGHLNFRLGRYQAANELIQESLCLLEYVNEDGFDRLAAEKAFALRYLGAVARKSGDISRAKRLCGAALAISNTSENAHGTADSLQQLAIIAAEEARYEDARTLFQSARRMYAKLDDPYGVADALNNLAVLAEHLGQPDVARQRHEDCLAARKQLGDHRGVSMSLNNLGYIEYKLGQYAAAERHLQECLSLQNELGARDLLCNCLSNLGAAALAMNRLEDAADSYAKALKIAEDVGDPPLQVEILAGIASIAERRGGNGKELAATIYAFLLSQEAFGEPVQADAMAQLDNLQQQLHADRFAHALAQGRRASMDEIIQQAQRQGR